jgi:hypothetical protein
MKLLRRIIALLILGLLATGCGDSGFVKARGHIIKAGEPYLTGPGEGFRIVFAPIELQSTTQYDSYAASYNPKDGSFIVTGKNGKGLPPGNYRIGLQLMKSKEDLLNGRLLGKKSPLVAEVTSARNDIVIDLDQAHFDELLAAAPTKKPKTR